MPFLACFRRFLAFFKAFLLAKNIFKSGQKVAKWPEIVASFTIFVTIYSYHFSKPTKKWPEIKNWPEKIRALVTVTNTLI